MEVNSINKLSEVPIKYHHFFLNIEGLDFVEFTDQPELRFTLYFYKQNKIIFWYNDRIETRAGCSIIRPPCHMRENLRQERIIFCKNGIKKVKDRCPIITSPSNDNYHKKSLRNMRIEICRSGIISNNQNFI